MLSAQAYSFRLKSRLAIGLSWVGGYVNVILLIACGQTVSHQTGNTTRFGDAVGNAILQKPGARADVIFFGSLIGLFLLGAACSGILTENARRAGRSSKYFLPMIVEAMLLSSLVLLLIWRPSWLLTTACIASFAMGLQNATITRISGAVVRTTHLTGVITDLGLELVQLWHWWRDKTKPERTQRYRRMWMVSRRHPTVQRVVLLASIFGSFLFGVTAGTVLFEKIGPIALLAPVLFLTALILQSFFKPIADVREIDPTKDFDLGGLRSLLPADVGIFRLAHHKTNRLHHAPDFSSWVDRIPRRWRVVILVISPMTQFDSDTAASLLSAVQMLKSHDRTMVISGMNRVQFKTLVDCGMTRVIDLENFVPDLEFAIARGINLAVNPI